MMRIGLAGYSCAATPAADRIPSAAHATRARIRAMAGTALALAARLLRALLHLLLHLVYLLLRSILGALSFLHFLLLDGSAGRGGSGGIHSAAGECRRHKNNKE
jgi:hypothetical protein